DHVEQGLDARFSTVLQDLPNRLLRDPLAEEIGRLSDSLAERLGLRLVWLRLTVPVADGAPGVVEGFRRILEGTRVDPIRDGLGLARKLLSDPAAQLESV